MAERVIAHRKSQTYLNSVLPVRVTHKELVKKKLEAGKFLFTITGLVKIAGIVSDFYFRKYFRFRNEILDCSIGWTCYLFSKTIMS